tara:strand:- start:28709 stop:32107 length:3399 start_codon:yes stop_codon:yes gene_type:complete
MAKIKINKLPKGYTLKNGKVVKEASYGGQSMGSNYDDKQSIATTLQPVPRDEANIEAEKGETVLTDIGGDGTYQMYNIGGKRHSQGGTPLNLPEQSFIYSDTRKMLLTKDEMAELGIKGKKRITPAKASKKFAIKEFMDILTDEGSDELAISTAEAMIKKNKVKLSQLAFIQERKKNFEEGLPIAAYPYLLENGIDPRMVEQQIEKSKAQASQQQTPQAPAPNQGQPSPEQMQQMAMAMQQSQGMPQQPMANLGGNMADNLGSTDATAAAGSEGVRTPYGDVDENFGAPMGAMGLELKVPKMPPRMQNGGDGGAETYKQRILRSVEESVVDCKTTICSFEQWAKQYRMKDNQQTRFMYESYKTKAIDQMRAPEISSEIMPDHENMMPTAPINTQQAGFGNMLKEFIPGEQFDYIIDDPMQGMKDAFGYVKGLMSMQDGGNPDLELGNTTNAQTIGTQPNPDGKLGNTTKGQSISPAQMGGQPMNQSVDQSEMQMLMMGIRELAMRREALMNAYKTNPDAFQNRQDQENLAMQLQLIDGEIGSLQVKLKEFEDKELLRQTTLSLSDFIPGMEQQQQPQGFPTEMPMAEEGTEVKYTISGNLPANADYNQDGSYPIESRDYRVDTDDPNAQYNNPGMGKSMDWQALIGQDNFAPMREEWFRSYRDGIENFRGKKNSAGHDISYPEKYSNDELLSIFNELNSQLLIFDQADEALGNSGENYKALAKKYGLREMTKEEIKAWQGMYASLNETKKLPEYKDLFSNVSTELRGLDRGTTHQSSTGEPQSDADGFLGSTSEGQFVSIKDPVDTTTVENDCPQEKQERLMKECQEAGKIFNRATCSCMERPPDPVPGKVPPYLTFPGDDQEMLFAAQTVNNRELYLPDREQYIPYLRDPGYVGPRQEIAAITAAVNAQADMGDDSLFAEGKAQEAIERAINKSAQTNTKIFDNTQAYNIATLNEAAQKNAAFNNVYTDEVNTALQEYDNTRLQDLENLKDAEITRRDNADKLLELNMQNPNYFYNPQLSTYEFYNKDGLQALQNPGGTQKSFSEIYAEVETNYPAMSAEEKRLLAKQMYESQGGQGMNNTFATDIRTNNQNNNDTETSRFGGQYKRGGSTKQRRLNESKIKMRNFLLGIS